MGRGVRRSAGGWKVIAVETSVAWVFVVIAAAAVTGVRASA